MSRNNKGLKVHKPSSWVVRVYSFLMRVRPAQLADAMKSLLGVRRYHVEIGGHIFWIDPVSNLGFRLLVDGCYEPGMTAITQCLLRDGDVYLDVGGNEGYFSVLAAARVGSGMVHCIEPQARLASVIRENARANSARIRLHQLAVSDRDGHAVLFLRPSTNSGASSMFLHWRMGEISQAVRTVTLDTFFREQSLRRIRLMKVDCEGAECLVVNGGKEVLESGMIDFIAIEFHPGIIGAKRCAETEQSLRRMGYVATMVGNGLLFHRAERASELDGMLKMGCEPWAAIGT